MPALLCARNSLEVFSRRTMRRRESNHVNVSNLDVAQGGRNLQKSNSFRMLIWSSENFVDIMQNLSTSTA
jgi:hypothetical protein